jgi:hypothetical protein
MAMYHDGVRTTVTLDDDVAVAVERLRRERSVGLSEAVNELIRAGLRVKTPSRSFRQRTADLGLGVDVTNVAEALELLEGPDRR